MKPSILLVGNFLSTTHGNPSVGEYLAKQLESAGHRVFTTSHMDIRLFRLLAMVFASWRRRKQYQVAYVEVYSGAAFIWAEIVCRLLGILRKPYILALHGGNLPNFACRSPERVKRLLKTAARVTAPSGYLQEELRVYRSDIGLIPNPIELGHYPFRLRSKPASRLLWLRAFHGIYNPQMAPLVVGRLVVGFPEISLTMVGPDKGDGALCQTQAQIQRLGLEKCIRIVPGVPKAQVPEILNAGDIFVNTTNVDNAPVSVIEAMACGLCVVSTDVGGIPFLLKHEDDALLVAPNDPAGMAAAVRRILTEPGLAGRLSQHARQKVVQFDWSVILPEWEGIFREVLEEC